MIDYSKPTPETAAFMTKINDSFVDLGQVESALHDMEIERDHARDEAAEKGKLLLAVWERWEYCGTAAHPGGPGHDHKDDMKWDSDK